MRLSRTGSCLSTGCHEVVHNAAGLHDVKLWSEKSKDKSDGGTGRMENATKMQRRVEALERVGTRWECLWNFGSLLWSHPTAFVLFVMPGALLMGLGILLYPLSSRLPSRSTARNKSISLTATPFSISRREHIGVEHHS